MPISLRRTVVDWIAILLLLLPALLGIILFGAVRLWSIGPLMFLAALGMALFFLRPFFEPDLRRIHIPPGGLIGFFVLVYILVMIPKGSVPYEARIEVLKFGSYLGAYWVWSELAAHYRRWRFLLGLVIFAVTIIAWYAIIQHSQGTRMVLNLERPEVYGMRASGTYFCPNHFAHLLEIIMPLCYALMRMSSAGLPLRLIASYGLILFLPVMFLTQSRSGWIGTVVGLSTVICMIGARRGRKVFLITLVLVPLVIGITAAGLWVFSDIFRERVLNVMQGNIRLHIWSDTLAMIRQRPWLGWGAGSYQWVFPQFRTISDQMLFNYAHNEYLHFLADYGMIGLALFALVIVTACGKMFLAFLKTESERDAFLIAGLFGSLAATFAHAMFDFNLHLFSNNHVIILIAGITVACLYASDHWKPLTLKAPAWFLVYGGNVLAALALAIATLQVFLSYGWHYLGEQCREKFQMAEATRLFDKAIVIDPGNWRPYMSKAHVLMTQSFWNFDAKTKGQQAQTAVSIYQQAIARNPYDLEAVFGLGKTYHVLGEEEKALDCFCKAVAADPEHLFYVSHLGLQLRRMGRDQEALRVFRKAAAKWNDEMVTLNIETLERKLAETHTPP